MRDREQRRSAEDGVREVGEVLCRREANPLGYVSLPLRATATLRIQL